MAITAEAISRLKSQLLNSGLQQRNNALWQVINQLIEAVGQSVAITNSISGGGSGSLSNATFITESDETGTLPNSRQEIAGEGIEFNDAPGGRRVIHTAIPFNMGDGGEGGEDGPPGPQGPAGPQGIPGPAGSTGFSTFYAFDGEDGVDGLPGVTGPQGIAGTQGSIGPPGTPGIPGLDGEDGIDSYIPGPPGPNLTLINFTQDLGAAERSGTFDITGLSGLTVDKVVTIVETAAAVASKGNARDEFEMDSIQLTGYVVDASTIRVYWNCDNVVVGTYAFAYSVSG